MINKQLKEMYANELNKTQAPKMVDYYLKNYEVFEFNGELLQIEKPQIKTSFCYGYGYCGRSTAEDEEHADKLAQKTESDYEFFIEENLKQLNNKIEGYNEIFKKLQLNWAPNNHPDEMVIIHKSDNYGGNIAEQERILDTNRWKVELKNSDHWATAEEVEQIIQYLEAIKSDFIKRLNTYLKRFGLSKVRSWSYLVD